MGEERAATWFRHLATIGIALLALWILPMASAQSTSGNECVYAQESQSATDLSETSGSLPKQSQPESSDRIFGVVPAYTITDARNTPPLTSKQKFVLFVKGTWDPFPFAVYALQAGISQARDTHSDYGQGAGGYGKRFGAALADGTSARFFGTYAFSSLLRQDPRYFRKNEGGPWSRVRYSISRGFVTRADSGKTQVNWSNLLGKLVAGGLSNIYYPEKDRGAGLTFSRLGISLGYQTVGNLAIEFWPEIRRKLSRGKNGSPANSPSH